MNFPESKPLPTQAELLQQFRYCPDSGVLSYAATGNPAGWWNRQKDGPRLRLCLNGGKFYATRLIWRMQTGTDPGPLFVDHIDGDSTNNRWGNLRLADRSQSSQNRKKAENSVLPKGVYRANPGTGYRADIRANGRRVRLGYFATPEEAGAAYEQAASKLHGQYACTRQDAPEGKLL